MILSERFQDRAFALAWVVGAVVLWLVMPHVEIGTYLSTRFLGKEITTMRWAVYLLCHGIFLSLLWYAAFSFHIYVRDFTESYISDDASGLWDRLSLGLMWGMVTAVSLSLLFGLCSSGEKGTLSAYLFGVVKGNIESQVVTVFLAIEGLFIALLLSSRSTWTLFKKEFKIYFSTPIIYVVILLFVFITGYFFDTAFTQFIQQKSNRFNLNDHVWRRTLGSVGFIMLFFVPILTMRLIAEEKKNRTYELLMTGPLTTFEIVVSKFLSVVAVLSIILGITMIYPITVNYFSPGAFEWGPVLTSYLGLFFVAASFAAIGLFCSSLTENQIIAATFSFGVLLLFWIINWTTRQMDFGLARDVVEYLSITAHFSGFLQGTIEVKDIVYYLTLIIFANFLAHRMIESQRWS